MKRLRPAAFLDRDGVIIKDRGYVHRVEDMVLLPGAANALARLKQAGYLLIVVTNQSGIARGTFTSADMHVLHDALQRELDAGDASIDRFYVCPHHEAGIVPELSIACACRKPLPGLIARALSEWPVDRAASFMAGDKESDVEAGRKAGIGAVFRLGKPAGCTAADLWFTDLADCVDFVLDRREPVGFG